MPQIPLIDPWRSRWSYDGLGLVIKGAFDHCEVVCRDVNPDDAKLLCAAPELFECLRELVDTICDPGAPDLARAEALLKRCK